MASRVVELSSLLVSKPGYRDGRPCLRGTGITVHNVAATYSMGYTVEQLCAENPDLEPELFHAAIAYYLANRARIDAEIEEDIAYENALAARFPQGIAPATRSDA